MRSRLPRSLIAVQKSYLKFHNANPVNDFIRIINAHSALCPDAIAGLEAAIVHKEFRKNARILALHSCCRHLYFLKSGLVKCYSLNEKGREVIFRFFEEETLFTSLESFLSQKPAAHMIRALEPTEVYCISKTDLYGFLEDTKPYRRFLTTY